MAVGTLPGAAQFSAKPEFVGVPNVPAVPTASSTLAGGDRDPNAQMMVRATELQYDNANESVVAVGGVQIYYKGSVLEANKVVYDQKTKRMRAEGNVRLTEPDGKVVVGEIMELNDDFRDGFVDSLRVEAADKTRFAAPHGERTGSNYTVFQSGVYTACEPCKEDPTRAPEWQVRASRIIHDEAEKMIYFEQARLEFFGVPLFWMPYMSAPDPTVKRKTGILTPKIITSSKLGVGFEVPYFWALAPDYDVTLTPMYTTKQGLLLQGEWRQRLVNGSYAIRAAGIFQQDRNYFLVNEGPTSPGNRDFRGSIDTMGRFALNENWVWGWDGTLLSDKNFLSDYGIRTFFQGNDPFRSGGLETVSQLFLTGRGDRSYFDIRAMYFYGLASSDVQAQLAQVHPVIDYKNVLKSPILGGELSYNFNLTSLSRQEANFDPITKTAVTQGTCNLMTADTAVKTRTDCILRGVPGSYTRMSAETTWRRTIVDPYGQMFTPFASLRADVAAVSVGSETGVANFITPGDTTVGRFMPTVGLEYRYPFISVEPWGTQTIEPIAQLIVRPNETNIGKLPNEDAQSLIFDDSNLFSINKFSGWDRVEGGARANAGLQYTAHFNPGSTFNVLFGQSYQLYGQNSFANPDLVNTGLGSGLDKTRSDYVARIAFKPDSIYTFISRFRFDEATFDIRRLELEAAVGFARWSGSILYGNYDAQPDIGFVQRRQGILSTLTYKFTQNWSMLTAARYDLESSHLDQYRIGLGYIDDCFAIGVNYITDYSYNSSTSTTIAHSVMLQINLRTLGGSTYSQGLNQLASPNGIGTTGLGGLKL